MAIHIGGRSYAEDNVPHGLQTAIDKALALEALTRAPVVPEPISLTTFTAIYNIAGKFKKIQSTDLTAFLHSISKLHKIVPHLSVTYLVRTTTEDL